MALARLERRLHHIDAVQFPALHRRVNVILHELLGRFDSEVPLVGVVGDVHLLASYQLEIEAILLAGKHLQLVEQGNAALARYRRVIGELRRQLDAALTWRIAPGATRFLGRVQKIGNTGHLPRPARRLVVDRPGTTVYLWITVLQMRLIERKFLISSLLRRLSDVAVGVDNPTGVLVQDASRSVFVAQQLVPHHLVTSLGDGKRQAAPAIGFKR